MFSSKHNLDLTQGLICFHAWPDAGAVFTFVCKVFKQPKTSATTRGASALFRSQVFTVLNV